MCGISGILHFDTDRRVNAQVLQNMTRVLTHRGPDGEGFYIDKNIGLGHKRLAIIDLTTGSQPMVSEDKKLIIVFNGEIYNYLELKETLKSRGHIFTTSSDTEVILKAYKEWGFDCQTKFNGMWAFAIWDTEQKTLFLSRDRIGEKPLHFSIRDNSFLFGSEIKSLLASGYDYQTANHLLLIYLSLGYVPTPETFYKGIVKLKPGHFLVVRDGKVNERCYWNLPNVSEKDMRTDSAKIYQEFEECFADSVRIRMRSDVPFGAFLSGGLDSSSVAATMAQYSNLPVETFSIGFAQKSFDERQLARQVAERFSTNHHEQLVEPAIFDKALEMVLFQFDEPFGDASAINVGLVSQMAREQVKMVLTGDGGDEVLSGYTSYLAEKFTKQYQNIPAFIRNAIHLCLKPFGLLARNTLRYKLNRLNRFMHLCDKSFEERLVAKMSLLDPGLINRLIIGEVPQLSLQEYLSDVFSECSFTDPFYQLMYFNLKISLPDDMLTKVDRMSMAHSLEARVPFLDHRLVELTYCVHKDIKLQGYSLKNLLKQTHARHLPHELLKAPKKPFSVPLREWFKQDSFDSKLMELDKNEIGLDRATILDILRENKDSKNDYGDFIWRLVVLKRWINNYDSQFGCSGN